MRYRETEADLAVKARLWEATEREVMRFANSFAEGHVVGARRSAAQADTIYAAKKKGYPIGLIESVGAAIRRGDDARIEAELLGYRPKIGLHFEGAR